MGKRQRYNWPPSKIRDLIDRINLVPPDVGPYYKNLLPPLGVQSVDAFNWRPQSGRWSPYDKPVEKWTHEARMNLYDTLNQLREDHDPDIWGTSTPEEFISFIWNGDEPWEAQGHPFFERFEPDFDIKEMWYPTLQAVQHYEDFVRLREQFDYITIFVSRHPSWKQQFDGLKRKQPSRDLCTVFDLFEKDHYERNIVRLPIFGQVKIEIVADGSLHLSSDELVTAILESDDFDTRYIRKCLGCKRVFCASRREAFRHRTCKDQNEIESPEAKKARNKQKRENRITRYFTNLKKRFRKGSLLEIVNDTTLIQPSSRPKLELGDSVEFVDVRLDKNSWSFQFVVRSGKHGEGIIEIPYDPRTNRKIGDTFWCEE